jgi:hypothetical protein
MVTSVVPHMGMYGYQSIVAHNNEKNSEIEKDVELGS